MKNKGKLFSAIIGACLAIVVVFALGAMPAEPKETWEYHIETHVSAHPDMELFNELGADGWELVSHYTTSIDHNRGFVFKRKR